MSTVTLNDVQEMGRAGRHDGHQPGRGAARHAGRERVRHYDRRRWEIPLLGEVAVPPPDKVAYYAGLGALAALQVIEWPLALVITAGHVLADQHLSGLARGVGEALESA